MRVSNIYLRGCNSLNNYQKCSKRNHRYLRYISFRKWSQIWANLAHRPVNYPKTCMKIWQNCQKHAWLWEAVTRLIFIKNAPKNPHRYLRYISFRKSSLIWASFAHGHINWPKNVWKFGKNCHHFTCQFLVIFCINLVVLYTFTLGWWWNDVPNHHPHHPKDWQWKCSKF